VGEPTKAMLLRAVVVGGREIPAGTGVWLHRSGRECEIEHRGKRSRVAEDAIVDLPVAAPTLERLRELDACFGLAADAFDVEHDDAASFYSIVRCKAHGRRFLRDLRGGIASYETVTLLEDADDTASPEDVWRRIHAMPLDWLHHLGRTL
jgi:hypothetical protein